MKYVLTLTSLKYLVRKSKNQSGRKKKLREREMQKPLWFEMNKEEFEELTRKIYNNQDNNDFKIIINRRTYDLKTAQNFWMEVTALKTTKRETKKMYNESIQTDNDALERKKSDEIEESDEFKKYDIL